MYLYQKEDGFLFNSDAHFLFDFITRFNPKGNLLDIGAGCGIVGLLCAREFPINLTLIDKQKENSLLCQQNARVNSIKAEIVCADFLNHPFCQKFDFIVSNPPYYHKGVSKSDNLHAQTSKDATHLPFEAMLEKINTIIKPKGYFIFCYDAKQTPKILSLLKEKKFQIETLRFVHGTEQKPAHLVLIQTRKGSKALTKILPPLFNFYEGIQSNEVKSIYQKTRTHSIKCKLS